MNETPSRSYIKNRDDVNGDHPRQTVTTTFVEFDQTTPTGQSTPTNRGGAASRGTDTSGGPAAGGLFPTGDTSHNISSSPSGQGLNSSVNDSYADRSGNQLGNDTGISQGGPNGDGFGQDNRESLASAYSQNTQRQSQLRPDAPRSQKSHGSHHHHQYLVVENAPTPRKGSVDYTAAAANWDPAAGAVVESTPRGEYPPQLGANGASGADGYDQHDRHQQDQHSHRQQDQHHGLRNAGAAAAGGAAGAATGTRFADHHDDRYGDDYHGDQQQKYASGGQRLPQTGGRAYDDQYRSQQQQQYPGDSRGGHTAAAVGAGGAGNDVRGQDRGYDQQQQQQQYQDGTARSRSRQTSFREQETPSRQTSFREQGMPRSTSDRHNLSGTAAGAGIGAGVGAGAGGGMRRSASAGSGLIRGNRDRGTGSIGHSRPSTADGYRDKDRFRRGPNAGYDDRLPPVEDYDEDDEVRGLDVGDVISPQRQRQLQGGGDQFDRGSRQGDAFDRSSRQGDGYDRSSRQGDGYDRSDRASTQPRTRSAFGHRPAPGERYDEFGEGYGRPPTRADTIRSTRSRRTAGGTRRGAFGQGAALSVGTTPHDQLSRQDLHERASLAERALSPSEVKRLQGMEKKDAKRLTKLMKEEERSQAKSLDQAIADMRRLTKLQKEAISKESKSQRNLAKWTSREHKARLHFLKMKERYEAIEAKLRNAENDFEERRDHAYGLTEQVAERQQEIDDMRAIKAADDRERAVKRSTLAHPGHH